MVSETPGAILTDRIASLAAALRRRDVRVGVGEVLAAHRALDVVDAASRADVALALRAVLIARREDLGAFDAAFREVFGAPDDDPATGTPPKCDEPSSAAPSGTANGHRHSGPDEEPVAAPNAWSAVALDRTKNFSAYDDEERAALRIALVRLARRTPLRRSRRTRPSRGRNGRALDLRGTVLASLSHFGEPVQRHWRMPTEQPRPLVLVCDVSGSMAPYARVLLQYLQACVTARRRVEAFVFGTRLTRITRELALRDPDEALRRASDAVTDWSGGTRIGESLGQLNREHGRRLGRGSVVVMLSDGWDRGDPALLEAEMARLRRTAHRVVWVNPLAAQPEYQPLARGMRTALPHTACLLPGESLASLEQLVDTLEGL
jgi:uncharacterized protein with von Willebrand factor type A (vWA) domain